MVYARKQGNTYRHTTAIGGLLQQAVFYKRIGNFFAGSPSYTNH